MIFTFSGSADPGSSVVNVIGSLKELFRRVYGWKFMNCLELWTGAICTYSSEANLKPLAYPLTQIITGTARLVPTAQYFPLRLWCIKMLNRIAASTGTFIPVSLLLLDMLEMKELHRPPTGGVGAAMDFCTVLKVKKSALKTRAFQEACIFSVIEELTEHLAQWSYSVAFFELSFVPTVRLRNFCKSTKVERFRREMRQLIRQIEANCEFTNKKRMSVSFHPKDLEAASFVEICTDAVVIEPSKVDLNKENEKKHGPSPLSQYAAVLRQQRQQRNSSITTSSVLVGERTSTFESKVIDNDEEGDSLKKEGAAVFNSSWLPGNNSKTTSSKEEKDKKKKRKRSEEAVAFDEDVVEDLVLSSDEEESSSPRDLVLTSDEDESSPSDGQDWEVVEEKPTSKKWMNKKQKPSTEVSASSKKRNKFSAKKSNKKKRRI